VLAGDDIKKNIAAMIEDVIATSIPQVVTNETTLAEIVAPFEGLFLRRGEIAYRKNGFLRQELFDILAERAFAVYDAKEKELGLIEGTETPLMRELERVILLRVVDEYWMEHIDAMEDLRDGVRLRAYGQVNPVDEYKREGFEMFEAMISGMKDEVVRRIFTARVQRNQTLQRRGVTRNINAQAANAGGDDSVKKQPVKTGNKVGRNDPCPCGKLKDNGTPVKYKNCHGRDA
jgi:preprotein translocase subunit SecA